MNCCVAPDLDSSSFSSSASPLSSPSSSCRMFSSASSTLRITSRGFPTRAMVSRHVSQPGSGRSISIRSQPISCVSSASWRISSRVGRMSGDRCDSRMVRYVNLSVAGGRESLMAAIDFDRSAMLCLYSGCLRRVDGTSV